MSCLCCLLLGFWQLSAELLQCLLLAWLVPKDDRADWTQIAAPRRHLKSSHGAEGARLDGASICLRRLTQAQSLGLLEATVTQGGYTGHTMGATAAIAPLLSLFGVFGHVWLDTCVQGCGMGAHRTSLTASSLMGGTRWDAPKARSARASQVPPPHLPSPQPKLSAEALRTGPPGRGFPPPPTPTPAVPPVD